MDNYNIITPSSKFKHLSFQHYEYIIREITKHDAFHHGKKRNTGRTALIRSLASDVGTSVSNVYSIIKDASISILDSNLITHKELSASAAFHKRTKLRKVSNISKLDKAKDFIDLVVNEVKSNKLSSIDETVNNLILHHPDKITGMTTVCTKTIYNYVHQNKIDLKPIDLPGMTRRKPKKNYKEYIPKRQKGTPISERPFEMDDRSEFGHWEGDLVTGPRDGQSGAYLTLIERKPGSKEKRTSVYFGRPYHSCDRASNENCNGLIRRFIKKGTDINTVDLAVSRSINRQINNKKRKILGYISAEQSFLHELTNIGFYDDSCFYV